jgi:hypothetical protein
VPPRGPGFLTGILLGVLAGIALVSALPSLGQNVRAFATELGVGKASASSPGVRNAGVPANPATPAPAKASAPALRPMVFPAYRPLTVGVFGDSMADGLWAGLYRQMKDGKTFEVVKFSRASTGLSRYDYVDIQAKTAGQLATRKVDIAVIMFGTNDIQGIVQGKTAHAFNTPGWRAIYVSRIDNLVGLLRRQGAVVYWVGLPKMRGATFDHNTQILNAIYAERMAALGVPFIPTTPVTVDKAGAYNAYLPSGGQPRLMRAQDGIHMTMVGYLRVASPVSSRITADVARASPPPIKASSDLKAAGH